MHLPINDQDLDQRLRSKGNSVRAVDRNNSRSVFTARERELVDAARIGRLATVRPNGRPHLVPVTFAVLSPSVVVTAVDHKPKRSANLQRLRNIEGNPHVCLLIDHYDDDWATLWWLRLDGTARTVRDEPARSALAEALVAKYEAYVGRAPAGPVMAIDIQAVTTWNIDSVG
jgi:PPOX class probable F420-dependent enzyme